MKKLLFLISLWLCVTTAGAQQNERDLYSVAFYNLENLFDTINSLRVEKAKELLLRGDKKIYEIAALTGFEDTAYFSKVFKKYAGCPPKEYEQSGGRNL